MLDSLSASNDVAILSRVIAPEEPTLSPEAARALLSLSFPQQDRERMNQLAEKAREGKLTEKERVEIESYERVGHVIGLLQSKARRSLKQAPPDA
jgi:hypothetical protein